MTQYTRVMPRILAELSEEFGIDMKLLADGWLVVLERAGIRHYIYGYDWGINSSSAQLIAKDKAVTHEILKAHGIASFEHILVFGHEMQKEYFSRLQGCWQEITEYAAKRHCRLVCKPNKGTGGQHVFFIANQFELEDATHFLLSRYTDVSFSPWYDIANEYRVIVLHGKALVSYVKECPFVTGDGRSTLARLIAEKYDDAGAGLYEENKTALCSIPLKDATVALGRKHNLGAGARANPFLEVSLAVELEQKAADSARAIGITFASVDIAEVGGEFLVAEINSGVMIEKFASQPPCNGYDFYEKAKSVYRAALTAIFIDKK